MEKTHSNLLRNGGGFFEASKVLGWQQAHKQGDSGSPDGEPSEMPGVGPAGGEGTSCSSSPSPQVGCLHLLGFGSESAWPLSLNPAAEPSTLLPAAGCRGPQVPISTVESGACLPERRSRWSTNGCGRGESSRVREQGIQGG